MPDYSLGRAHGRIEIDYDGSGAGRAARDLDRVTDSSSAADESLSKTERTLQSTGREFDSAGSSAQGYRTRLEDVRRASNDVDAAERELNATLLDSRSTVDDIEASYRRLEDTRKRHTRAVDAERDAHRALSSSSSGLGGVISGLAGIIPDLSRNLDRLRTVEEGVTDKAGGLSSALGTVAKVVGFLGPQGKAAAGGLLLVSEAMDKVDLGTDGIKSFVANIASLETAVGKVSGLALGGGALAGLAGIGGAAGIQGIVNLAGAAKQLSGVLGLLPAMGAGAAAVMGTLQIAFQGVDSALTDMMADDPKKFLEDIANMGPAAAQSMLNIAQFRDQFKLAGGAVQDSFFSKIASDIAPLIQTWLPALTRAGTQIAGVLGGLTDHFAQLMMQPAMTNNLAIFVDNITKGLQAMQPAMVPLINILSTLTTVGSESFATIGNDIARVLDSINGLVQGAAKSGALQEWITSGIHAFEHLVDIASAFGQSFVRVMNIADKFGGGGLLGWLDQIGQQLNAWTKSAAGQKALTDFFSTIRQAADAFTPLLKPLVEGLASIGTAFVQMGIGIAPGLLSFFNGFASAMAQLGPSITGTAPAINQFLMQLAGTMVRLVQQVGPQLPKIFEALSNAFVALLPQLPQLVDIFIQFVDRVGPQLPKLFETVTGAMGELVQLMPTIIGFIRSLVSYSTFWVDVGAAVIKTLTQIVGGIIKIGDVVMGLPEKIGGLAHKMWEFFGGLAKSAVEWGKNIVKGLINGLIDATGLGGVANAAKSVVDTVTDWFPSSPAKRGPLSGSGYTTARGQKMVEDFAVGMVSAQSSVASAAASTAATASDALGATSAAAPGGSDTSGAALLPPNIAGADNSILSAYLRHQFPENRGLKGLAKDLGNMLEVAQSGFNLVSQNILQPLFTGLGMVPGMDTQRWTKMSPKDFAAQQEQKLQRDALQGKDKGPDWQDVLGPNASAGGAAATPLGLTASSSKEDIQKGIIAAGRARGMNDAAIQTALAVAAAESGFNPTISGGVQGSAGLVSGLFQQSPSSGWGTIDQVNDPNHAINAFYDAYAKKLKDNPADPMLAAVLTQNPQLGSGAQGSDYWNAVSAKLGMAGGVLSTQGKGVKGPGWGAITGAAPAVPAVQPRGSYTSDDALLANVPAGRYTQSQDVDLTKGLADCSSAVEDLVNMMDGQPTGGRAMSTHNADKWLTDRGFVPGSMPGAFNVGFNSGHMQATLPGGTPFNWGSDAAAARRGIGGTGAYDPAFTSHYYRPVAGPATAAAGGGIAVGARSVMLPSGKTVDELTNNTAQTASASDQLLQAYLRGNPALASQIDAAKTPGAPDDQVMSALTGIDSTITGLKSDEAANKNTIDALQSAQRDIAQNAGFQQSPSALSTAQNIASSASGAIGSLFKVAQSGLDALTATQDIADRLVYGVRNTEDVNKLVDNFQKYITLAADIFSAAGSIMSTVGSFTGGADMGGTSGAGGMLSLISSVLQGVNAAIDFGQQVYHIVGTYVGRFLSQLTAGLAGTPLMGDVRFLLNKNTGQLISYSQDNPGNKNTQNVPSWMNSMYDYGGGSNPNPTVNTQWNIYAGPGQSPGQMLNEVVWMYNTQGTSGAMAPANF